MKIKAKKHNRAFLKLQQENIRREIFMKIKEWSFDPVNPPKDFLKMIKMGAFAQYLQQNKKISKVRAERARKEFSWEIAKILKKYDPKRKAT